MADFTLVDPKGWEYDLHSVRPSSGWKYSSNVIYLFLLQVYSAYMGYFQIYNVPWYMTIRNF